MASEELSRRISEATSIAMREYWSRPGVKRRRKAAAIRRRHIRRLEARIRTWSARGMAGDDPIMVGWQRELDRLRAEHEQASTR
jgi:hypothetical protein